MAGATRRWTPRSKLAHELVAAGADIVDIGGESATTGRPPVEVERELELVVELVARVAGELDTVISVDTYKPVVARAAIAAGAAIVNDVSGLRDRGAGRGVRADRRRARGDAHARRAAPAPAGSRPVWRRHRRGALPSCASGSHLAIACGVDAEQLIVDPGPDFAKTPAQTITLLRDVARLHELQRPLLLAISRKDFIGALTGRPPRGRLAGTLAALAHGQDAGAHIFRVHDVAAAADFIAVRGRALGGARARQGSGRWPRKSVTSGLQPSSRLTALARAPRRSAARQAVRLGVAIGVPVAVQRGRSQPPSPTAKEKDR